MDGERQQRVDALLMSILIEEGHARLCAQHAQEMAESNHDRSAAALLKISHDHLDKAVELRAALAALVPPEERMPSRH